MSSLLYRICQLSKGLILFLRPRRSYFIFIFFLILSGVFWLVTTLNQNYDEEITISVRIDNMPKNLIIVSDQYDSLRVTVQDKGYNLLDYYTRRKSMQLVLDYKNFVRSNGKVILSHQELVKAVQGILHSTSTVHDVHPTRMELMYCLGKPKRVPVVLAGNYKAADDHYLSETLVSPKTVMVYGTDDVLQKITAVRTEPLNVDNLTDTLRTEVNLAKIQGARIEPKTVKVTLCTDILMEDVAEVQVVSANVPEGMHLRTFPSKVKVKFTVGISQYKKLDKNLFAVHADFRSISEGDEKCALQLVSVPDGVMNVTLDVSQADYLIENDNSDHGRDR